MCGWVGVFGGTEPSIQQLEAGSESLVCRGPDDHGLMISDAATFGIAHRRLAILDPTPAGHQPMRDDATGTVIVYNGEIYNSPALRAELKAAGIQFQSMCDTEVLLRGWIHWGDAVVERIEGMFSFALFDEKRQRAFLGRDRLGIKPLYWAMTRGTLIAGSAPRAILEAAPHLREGIDRVALAQYLALLWIPHPRTPWAGIKKLAPGHTLSMTGGRVTIRPYRELALDAPDEPLPPAELAGLLDDAVQRQLLSDVPVGLLLSGGLDSTLLLALMDRHYQGERLTAVCVHYTDEAKRLEIVPDDLVFARRAAAAFPRVDLRTVRVGDDDWALVDELAPHFDDPVADPAAIAMYLLARASETKVVLSGVGGEELFGGYPRHRALGLARRAANLPGPVRQLAGIGTRHLRGSTPGPGFAARRNLEKLGRAVGMRRTPHYWRLMSQIGAEDLRLLMPDVADEAMAELDAQSPALVDADLRQALSFDTGQFLANLNLAYTDKASMAASVEVRVPLLDEAIIARALRAPSSDLIRDGVQKAVLKDAARGLIADEIIERPKSGLGGPMRSWVQGTGGDSFAERVDGLADAGFVARDPARALVASARSGETDSGLAVWAMVCLEVWRHAHLDRHAP